jgi:hypothetical protein
MYFSEGGGLDGWDVEDDCMRHNLNDAVGNIEFNRICNIKYFCSLRV